MLRFHQQKLDCWLLQLNVKMTGKVKQISDSKNRDAEEKLQTTEIPFEAP